MNRCANRYHFAVAFLAACQRGATNLLPPGVGPQARDELLDGYPGAWLVEDAFVSAVIDATPNRRGDAESPSRPHDRRTITSRRWCSRPAARASRVRTKNPGARSRCRRAYCRLRLGDRAVNVVVTVPPQHMYGLETSVFTLLAGDWALHDGNAFYPDEIVAALNAMPAPRLLITAPYHLRHLLTSARELPRVDLVLSATAPLGAELARGSRAPARRRSARDLRLHRGGQHGHAAHGPRGNLDAVSGPGIFGVNDGATAVRAAHLRRNDSGRRSHRSARRTAASRCWAATPT